MAERTAHGARVLRITEVSKRLIRKHALWRAGPDGGGDACNGHNEFSLDQMTADWNEGVLGTGMEVRQGQAWAFCTGEGSRAKIAARAAVLP